MNPFKSLLAWIAAPFRKVKVMSDTDEINTEVQADAAPVAEDVPVVEAAAPAAPEVEPAPARDAIQVLEGILSALGHELPAFWAEAAALARKVL